MIDGQSPSLEPRLDQVVTYTAAISACHNVSESLAAPLGWSTIDAFFKVSWANEQPIWSPKSARVRLMIMKLDSDWWSIRSFCCLRCEPNGMRTLRWKVALHLLHEMRLKEVSPNTATYNSVPRNKSVFSHSSVSQKLTAYPFKASST